MTQIAERTIWNPCCGAALFNGAKAAAAVDVILSLLEVGGAMVFESRHVKMMSTEVDHPANKDENYIVSITLLFGMCLFMMRIVQLGFSILLLYGVVQKNYKKCEIWIIFSLVVIALATIQILYEIFIRSQIIEEYGGPPLFLRIVIPAVELVVTWYLMWVIAAFMHSLKKSNSETQTSPSKEKEVLNA